jgi:hypothetical protein
MVRMREREQKKGLKERGHEVRMRGEEEVRGGGNDR